MSSQLPQQTITQIVRNHYRTAAVFKKHSISYCCGGQVVLEEACRLKGLDLPALVYELEAAAQPLSLPANLPHASWSLPFLIDYIIHVHHFYLQDTLPKLRIGLTSFVLNHQKKMPCLTDVLTAFTDLASVVEEQVRREEEVIFPYIKQVEGAHRRRESYGSLLVRALGKPVQLNAAGSDEVLASLEHLRILTQHYSFSEKACTTHRVLYRQLEELDGYLMHQQGLRNDHLLPTALRLQRELLAVCEPQ